MPPSHFETIRFLPIEQIKEVFEDSCDSLHEFRDANDMLSIGMVKAIVEGQLWVRLQELYESENPMMQW